MASGRYRSLSGAIVDSSNSEKKQRNSNEYDDEADAPDLVSSSSYAPMLGNGPPRRPAYSYHLPRRRFSRYFTLIIAAVLVFFIYYLFHASWTSQAEVRLGLKKKPPPPPAWESFPFLKRYHGGIKTLVKKEENVPEYPVGDDEALQALLNEAMLRKAAQDDKVDPHDNAKGFGKRDLPQPERFDPYAREWDAEFEPRVKCYLNNETKLEIPQLLVYPGVTKGFPEPVMGSHELFGLRNDVCFERHGRLGPYGFGYSSKFGGTGAGMEGDREGVEAVWDGELEIDYRKVEWGPAQEACMEANAHRFLEIPEKKANHFFTPMRSGGPAAESSDEKIDEEKKTKGPTGKPLLPRTAVIIRTMSDYKYDKEDIIYLRALMSELALQSGGEYTVHFLVHVKDDNLQIWADEDVYQRTLNDVLPREFRGMGTLWSERQMGLIYGGVDEHFYRDLPVHGAYRSTYMPVQYFAHMHPEYDFFWQWEMDVRYTGHFYHLFNRVSEWARQQPRKGLWERNSRFYVPAEHGTWEDFRQLVRVQIDSGTSNKQNMYHGALGSDDKTTDPLSTSDSRRSEQPIWGPLPPTNENDHTANPDADPQPPSSYDKDTYTWGVGEEADFITFNPLFDPSGTNWILAEDVTGYNTNPTYPPRRTAIITASRLSRRLLTTMHAETTFDRHTMFSEMWPGSCALHHGYKAVYAPHPVYIDRAWPTSYLAAVFNNGRNGASGGARTSVFSDERQHNFLGTTWYYHAGFAANLWKRWLGYKVDNDGGEEWELGVGGSGAEGEAMGEGRMCLPAMLLHPVKQVDLVFEHEVGED
ncbi:hypothetical protein MBLNU230_g6343t1 [Neophaeotheca triangularis]